MNARMRPGQGIGLARPEWLPQSQWPFEIRHRDVHGNLIHYVDVGHGPVLLFVHAGMWSFVWRDVITELRHDFRCVALDFPGSGLSQAGAGYRVGLAGNSRVLAGLVAELGLTEITLVLHDLGGVVGLDYAARRPEEVRALVVAQTFGWWPRQRLLRAMLRLVGGGAVTAVNVRTNLIQRLTATRFGVGRRLDGPGRRAFLGPTRERGRREPFTALMHDVSRSRPRLDAIEAALRGPLRGRPVLTIFGERNDPAHFQRDWLRLFPTARQVVVPKGNHFPMNDAPDTFAAAVRAWWSEVVQPQVEA